MIVCMIASSNSFEVRKKIVDREYTLHYDGNTGGETIVNQSLVMHEMSVALSIVEAVDAKARREGAGSISEIALVVGRLAGIEPDALRFCFSAAAKGTLAEKAVLIIEEREGRGVCSACRASFPVSFHVAECPTCRSLAVRVISGEEFLIESITIEDGE